MKKNEVQDIIGMIRAGHLSRTGRGLKERLAQADRSILHVLTRRATGSLSPLLLLAWQMGYRI